MLHSLALVAVGLFTCVMTWHGVRRLRARQVLDGVVAVACALAWLALWRVLSRWLQAQEEAIARSIARAVTDAVVGAYRVERRHGPWGLPHLTTDVWRPLDAGERLSSADPAVLHHLLPAEEAMDRFTRFKLLRALWARARALMAWMHGPQLHQLRQRYHYWQHVHIAERHVRDGVVRGSEDPDASLRPMGAGGPEAEQRALPLQSQAERRQQFHEAQRLWQEQVRRQAEGQRQAEQCLQAAQQRNGVFPHPRR